MARERAWTAAKYPLALFMSVRVRARGWGVLSAFFSVLGTQATAPQNVRGSVLTYSSEQLLVHLDDQDERMQRAVFAVLEVRVVLFEVLAEHNCGVKPLV